MKPLPPNLGKPPQGLREFITTLDAAGFLVRHREPVDWRFQLGERSRRSDAPLLFEQIKDYPGHAVFTGGLSRLSYFALALGLEASTPRTELIRILKERLNQPRPPVEVNGSSFPVAVTTGAEVNLYSLPIPQWSELDVDRYVGTWHVNITRDPETGKRNLGIYRMQVLAKNRATVSVSPRSHLARHMEKAERARRPLDMAVAIGVAEPVIIAGGAALPFDTDELSVAGGFLAQPVEVRKCRTVDLEAPANSEIVLEGRILPGERTMDGPYLDYAGVPSQNPRAYVFEITAIMQRERPIFRGMAVGRPGAEDHQLFAVLAELGLVDFHGSSVRQRIQNAFLRRRCFRFFQWSGRLGYWKSRLKKPSNKCA